MTVAVVMYDLGRLGIALVVVRAIALLSRLLAERLGQPGVVGEIAVGLLIGPALLASVAPQLRAALLPEFVFDGLKLFGQAGLALYLVGVVHEVRPRTPAGRTGALAWLTVGATVLPLAAGGLLAGWVLLSGQADLRGSAPTAAFVLLLMVTLTVTAVPVLARILDDRGLATTRTGGLALRSAMVIDVLAWLLLATAIGLASGTAGGVLRAMGVLVVGLAAAFAVRWVLGATAGAAARFPVVAGVLLGAAAIGAAWLAEYWGLTAIFGAVVVGLAVPRDRAEPVWAPVVHRVSTVGSWLIPVLFVTAGIGVWTTVSGDLPWLAVLVSTALAVAGKVGGTYLGARIAALPHWTALRLGVLLNTRGLTEILLLQAGYSAGILAPGLYLALTVMALLTTAMTGPLLTMVDRVQARRSGVKGAVAAW